MTDGEYSLLMLLGLVTLCAVYLFAIVRNQKKTIATLSTSASTIPAEAQLAQKEREVEDLRKRIQVLERITVEKENSLAREIEELRDR